jgi:hypothetical protein
VKAVEPVGLFRPKKYNPPPVLASYLKGYAPDFDIWHVAKGREATQQILSPLSFALMSCTGILATRPLAIGYFFFTDYCPMPHAMPYLPCSLSLSANQVRRRLG